MARHAPGDDDEPLVAAQHFALKAIAGCVEKLEARLKAEKNEMPPVDATLEIIAKNEDKMTKEQKRDKVMFEGQQEFDWEQSLSKKVATQAKRGEDVCDQALNRVHKVLLRRWQRRRNRDRPMTLKRVEALASAVDQARARFIEIQEEHDTKAETEAAKLQADRRRLQEQTSALYAAAIAVRAEKARMAEAWEAPVRERQKLMLTTLRRVRRLTQDMKTLPVTNEFKQKHSVLLYSLRMLEASLQKEVPNQTEVEALDQPLDLTAAQQQEIQAQERAFEEQLKQDLEALRESYQRRASRAITEAAIAAKRAIEAEHLTALSTALAALEASKRARAAAEAAPEVLGPLAGALQRLAIEAFRHEQVAKGLSDVASFGPHRKRLLKALEASLQVMAELRPMLVEGMMPRGGLSGSIADDLDRTWEQAVTAAAERWQIFCEAYPDSAPDQGGSDTPRNRSKTPSTAGAFLEDLDVGEEEMSGGGTEPPSSPEASPARSHRGGATPGNKGASQAKPPVPRKPAPPPAKPAANSRPPGRGPAGPGLLKPPPPGARAAAANAASPSRGRDSGKNKAKELLERLDQASRNMDTALGKDGTFSRTLTRNQSSGKPPDAPPKRPGAS